MVSITKSAYFIVSGCSRQQLQRQVPALCALRHMKTSAASRTDAIAAPPLDGAPKQYSPKIQQLVNDIASLTLLEVSDLNELLKVCVKAMKCFETKSHHVLFDRWLLWSICVDVVCFLSAAENFKYSGCWDDADGCGSCSCCSGDYFFTELST